MQDTVESQRSSFHFLTPDLVINLVEKALGQRCQNLCWPLASYINRVYELKQESGESVIAKFYRPGRWSSEALRDEQTFLLELAEQEIPVVPPMVLPDGSTLAEHDGMYYALFPKKSGRPLEEPNYEQWTQLGRLLARTHAVGALHPAEHRVIMHPQHSTRQNIETILRLSSLPPELGNQYEKAASDIVALITPMFEGIEQIRIHGDCHKTNIVYRPDESFYLFDFDDMAMGPPVQDFWMLLPGYSRDSLVEIDYFLEGYETFRPLDRKMMRLIEPLRAMRYIHFTAWCAVQAADGGFARIAPDWGSTEYWRREINDLERQREEILASADDFTGGQPLHYQ